MPNGLRRWLTLTGCATELSGKSQNLDFCAGWCRHEKSYCNFGDLYIVGFGGVVRRRGAQAKEDKGY
jgi:hypothetical protein